jgi:hypothetical protein
MKKLIIAALVATSFPALTSTATAAEGSSARERRHCVQTGAARAGSRMTARRICRTAAQWQDALGPDWRQRLTGRSVQDDLDTVAARSLVAVDDTSLGQQGVPFGHPGRAAMRGANPN